MWQRFLRAGSFSQTIILEPCLEGKEAQALLPTSGVRLGQAGGGKAKPKAGPGSWTQDVVRRGGGQRSGLEPGQARSYSQHGHIEGIGDVGRGGQVPAAVEALGVSVGAAAERGLPRRHWGRGQGGQGLLEASSPLY